MTVAGPPPQWTGQTGVPPGPDAADPTTAFERIPPDGGAPHPRQQAAHPPTHQVAHQVAHQVPHQAAQRATPTETVADQAQPTAGFALNAGDELSIWTITAQVNAGVTAHVYRARDVESLTGSDVALKVLLPQYAQGRQDEMVHEVEVMSRLTLGHPHLMASTLARRVTTGPYAGGVVIAMPWADGNLREYVLAAQRGQPLPDGGRWLGPRAMAEALAGIADGLAQLHELKTAHGDVKPDNILLVDGIWKLGDFGLTRPLEGSYVLSAPGTLSYTPPEEARAQLADPAAEIKRRPAGDVWALGVTLHFAVTGGRFPMPGINPDERLAAVRAGDIRIRPDVTPPALHDLLVNGLLVDDRDAYVEHSHHRRPSAAAAASALYRIAAGEHETNELTGLTAASPAGPEDALARYRLQCEQVARQTVSQWRELGPWDRNHAVTRARSRGVLDTMLANRLAATEPPPELRPHKSVAARALRLRSPEERCRAEVRQETVARHVPPRQHHWGIYLRLLVLLCCGLFGSGLLLSALSAPGDPRYLPLVAAAGGSVVCGGLGWAVLGGRFPEPAYIRSAWPGRVLGPIAGLGLAVGGLVAFSVAHQGGIQAAHPNLTFLAAVAPAVLTLAGFGWYVAGVLGTRVSTGGITAGNRPTELSSDWANALRPTTRIPRQPAAAPNQGTHAGPTERIGRNFER